MFGTRPRVHDYRAFRLEDLQLFGWELSAAEMAAINKLDVAAVAPDDPVKGVCLFKKKQLYPSLKRGNSSSSLQSCAIVA